MSTLKNKVAIVTGSTSGIGEGIAKMLADNGVKVVINSVRSVKRGEQLAAELTDAIYCQGDIGLESDCNRMINTTIKQFGQLDILVNNAGQSVSIESSNIFDISNEAFSQTLDINVVGTWCITRCALPYLKKSGDGNIINITSCAGIDPASASTDITYSSTTKGPKRPISASGAIPYSVAKAAINHLTKFLAKHGGPEIRTNAIAPGLIMTPRTENVDAVVNKFKTRTPLKRTGEPRDIAELVLAIIKSNYMNGAIILADGGFSTM